MATKEKLLAEVRRLIDEGNKEVLAHIRHADHKQYVEIRGHAKWIAGCRNLIRRLGRPAEEWRKGFESNKDEIFIGHVHRHLGMLESLERAIMDDLLIDIESLVHAEALGSIMDQATHLHANGYYVAAAVLGRTILEEHLRNLCVKHGCTPAGQYPTINSYNTELYGKTIYDKSKMQLVQSLATIGNDAAHVTKATEADTERMLRELPGFIALTQ